MMFFVIFVILGLDEIGRCRAEEDRQQREIQDENV